MVIELISVGTEILLGSIVNTNARFLAQECAALGLSCYHQVTVGDNKERLKEAMRTALSRADILLVTGGLGPTTDDITKETVAEAAGKPLVQDASARACVESYFQKLNRPITENNWKQADIIEGAVVVNNENGTAPGLIVELMENKRMILMPGPPDEMIPMFQKEIRSYLKKLRPGVFCSKMIKICGIGESKAETMVQDLIDNQVNPTIAPYAKTGEVHFRITAAAETEEEAKQLLKPMVKEFKERFGDHIYSLKESETLEEVVVSLLRKHKLTVTTAESCTGGLIAGTLINIPGASEVFHEGLITYSGKAKRKYLDVSKNTLKKQGAVSDKVAKEMAKGAAISTNSDISVAVTGLAGPDGATETIPVGLVYIACFANGKSNVKEYHFAGNRQKIRENAVVCALDLMRRCLIENYEIC